MVFVKSEFESASVTPSGAAWDVKANENTLFDSISVAKSVVIRNRAGNGDSVDVFLKGNTDDPIALDAGDAFTLENYPVSNILLTPGASFGVADKIDILITA